LTRQSPSLNLSAVDKMVLWCSHAQQRNPHNRTSIHLRRRLSRFPACGMAS
jgi:hypothetical protein